MRGERHREGEAHVPKVRQLVSNETLALALNFWVLIILSPVHSFIGLLAAASRPRHRVQGAHGLSPGACGALQPGLDVRVRWDRL